MALLSEENDRASATALLVRRSTAFGKNMLEICVGVAPDDILTLSSTALAN